MVFLHLYLIKKQTLLTKTLQSFTILWFFYSDDLLKIVSVNKGDYYL